MCIANIWFTWVELTQFSKFLDIPLSNECDVLEKGACLQSQIDANDKTAQNVINNIILSDENFSENLLGESSKNNQTCQRESEGELKDYVKQEPADCDLKSPLKAQCASTSKNLLKLTGDNCESSHDSDETEIYEYNDDLVTSGNYDTFTLENSRQTPNESEDNTDIDSQSVLSFTFDLKHIGNFCFIFNMFFMICI